MLYLFQGDKQEFAPSERLSRGQHSHPLGVNCGQVRHVAELPDVLWVVWRKKRSALETGWKVIDASELHRLSAHAAS